MEERNPANTPTALVDTAGVSEVRTFLIADVRGYTSFTLEHGDAAAARLAGRFATLAQEEVVARGGELLELRGDEALAVFGSTRAALRAAAELQARFAREMADDPSLPLKVGIGLDAGEAVPAAGGFRGAALNLAARLCSLAGAGEVLATETVTTLARKVDGLEYVDRGATQLKGFADPVKVIEVRLSSAGTRERMAGIGELEGTSAASFAMSRERGLPIGGYLGALPPGALVGRDAELARAIELVEATAAGNGRLLLLAGEPGAGKTRLAQEVTIALRNRDFTILAGRCYEPQGTVPFFPFVDALVAAYSLAPPTIRAQVPRTWPDLARLLPALGLPVLDFAGPEDQQRLFWTVTGFLQAMAAERPVAVLLDDLQWADAASLELLLHLARHTGGDRVFLLGTYRDVEVVRQHPLEAALRDLQREALVERMEVRRLGPEETSELIGATMGEEEVSGELGDLVYRRTEGNPFFIQQVMRVLVERGDIFRHEGRWDRRAIEEIEVPESVRSVVGQRLSRLPEETQEALRDASVLGQNFRFDDLQAMSGRSESELERALDAAGASGLLREMGRDAYAFDHALTQGSLYGELSSRRKRRLHLAAGEAIARLPERERLPRAAELAWHFLEGDDPQRALHWSMLAGEGAEAVLAHSDAEYHYRVARGLAIELDARALHAVSAERLGRTLRTLARNDEALAALEEAAGLYRDLGDPDAEVRVVAEVGNVLFQQTRLQEGLARLLPVLEARRDSVGPAATAALLAEIGTLYWASGRLEEALSTTEQAAAYAEKAGDTRLLAQAEQRWGTILGELHRAEEGLAHLDRAIELAKESGDLTTLANALNNRALHFESTGESTKAFADLERRLDVTRRLGNPDALIWSLGRLADFRFGRGELQRAEPYIDEIIRVGRGLRRTRGGTFITQALAMRATMGRDDAMVELEERAAEGKRTGDASMWAPAEIWLARLEMQDRPHEAMRRLEAVFDSSSLESQYRQGIAALFAQACVLAGDLERAESLVGEYMQSVPHSTPGKVEWLKAVGGLRARQERWDEAREAFDRALERVRADDAVVVEALLLSHMGAIYALTGEPDRACELLEEALAIFRRIGAKLPAERIEKKLAEIPQQRG